MGKAKADSGSNRRRSGEDSETGRSSRAPRRRASSPGRGAKREKTRPSAAPARRNSRMSPAPRPGAPLSERLRSVRSGARLLWQRLRRPVWMAGRLVLIVAIVSGAVAIGRLVERHVRTSPAFALEEVTLTGAERLPREEVLEAAGLTLGRNVFDVAPEEARARLSRHPWVATAEVQRKLPGTFEISIREHHSVAILSVEADVGGPAALLLVSEDGTVFKEVEEGDPVDLPVVTGVARDRFTQDRAFRTSILLEVVALLHDYRGAGLWRREPIGEVHVEQDDGLSLYVGSDATQVRLGRPPFRRKLARLRQVLNRLQRREARPMYVYLDNVRRPDRVTVRLRD